MEKLALLSLIAISFVALVSAKISLGKNGWFVDENGRVAILRGVNVGSNSKTPMGIISNMEPEHSDGRDISWVGKPFPLDEAESHFDRIKSWGHTTMRFLVPWEALEHRGPGIYDEEYIEYLLAIFEIAARKDLKLFVDPHQDVWSRFTGGSGAPKWTLQAAGFDVDNLEKCGAAYLHHNHVEDYERMSWPTNYHRLASATMFTLFFAGETYAPNTKVGGLNIQTFLQNHFFNAYEYLAYRIAEKGLGDVVIGFDTFNEPHKGLMGRTDLNLIEDSGIRIGPVPTFEEAFALSVGNSVSVQNFKLVKILGGLAVNFKADDDRVTLNRETVSCFVSGKNVWVNEGVITRDGRLKNKNYFALPDGFDDWADAFWVPFAQRFSEVIRRRLPDAIIFGEAAAMEKPPAFDEAMSKYNMASSAHFYDGLTLLRNEFTSMNLDSIRHLRKVHPVKTIAFGYYPIVRAFTRALKLVRDDGMQLWGGSPVLIGEVGIPYGLNNFEDYEKEVYAFEATLKALDNNMLSYTLWNYNSDNSHENGDGWNREDLSLVCNGPKCPIASRYNKDADEFNDDERFGLLPQRSKLESRTENAFVRPYPMFVNGEPLQWDYNPGNCQSPGYVNCFKQAQPTFTFSFVANGVNCYGPDGKERLNHATVIFVPTQFFGNNPEIKVKATPVEPVNARGYHEVTGYEFAVEEQKLSICHEARGSTIQVTIRPKSPTDF